MVWHMSNALGLTEELKVDQYGPGTNIIEARPSILIEFIALLKFKIQSQEEHAAQHNSLTPTLSR